VDAARRCRIVQGFEERSDVGALGEAFDSQRPLAGSRKALVHVQARPDARCEPKPNQARDGEDDRLVLPAIQLGEPRLDVAAQQAHLEPRVALRDLRRAAQA
jgi:hypothetical protein